MSPEVERLEALLARVQKNRAMPRVFEDVAAPRDAHSLPATDVLDASVDDALIVSEVVSARPVEPASAGPVLELEDLPAKSKVDDTPSIEFDLDEPAAAPVAAVAEAAPTSKAREESALAAAVQLAALDVVTSTEPPAPDVPIDVVVPSPAIVPAEAVVEAAATKPVEPSPAPVVEAAPAPVVEAAPVPVVEAPAPVDPRAPRPVVLTPPKAGHGPIVAIARAASAAPSPTFGDVVLRTLSLRPR